MHQVLIAESLDLPTLLQQCEQYNVQISGANIMSRISNSDISLSYQPDIPAADLPKYLAEFSGLIVRPKPVNAACFKAAPNLRLIVRGGAGLNSIDLIEAKKNSVIVENTPGENSISTAEYSFGLLWEMIANRQILRAHNDVIHNNFQAVEFYRGHELYRKTIAMIGFGAIGKEMAKRCLGFGMQVRVFSRSLKTSVANDFGVCAFDSLEELLCEKNDAISLHIPLTSATNNLFDEKLFALMPDFPAVLINAARPQLIDPAGLNYAVNAGKISRFAIDGDFELIEPFMELPCRNSGLFTHHIADTTAEAQANITRQVVKQIVSFFRDGIIINSA
jgi:phosphoglycerate dehydrogenase-like enzyme